MNNFYITKSGIKNIANRNKDGAHSNQHSNHMYSTLVSCSQIPGTCDLSKKFKDITVNTQTSRDMDTCKMKECNFLRKMAKIAGIREVPMVTTGTSEKHSNKFMAVKIFQANK